MFSDKMLSRLVIIRNKITPFYIKNHSNWFTFLLYLLNSVSYNDYPDSFLFLVGRKFRSI